MHVEDQVQVIEAAGMQAAGAISSQRMSLDPTKAGKAVSGQRTLVALLVAAGTVAR